MPTDADRARFFEKVDLPPDPTDCWLWNAATTTRGYGLIRWPGYSAKGPARAPRVAYELWKGSIPAGHEIDHLCNEPRCVNFTHLRIASHRENTLRSTNPCGTNARKTFCIHGHPFNRENTGQNAGGSHTRRCRTCSRIASRRRSAQCLQSPTT